MTQAVRPAGPAPALSVRHDVVAAHRPHPVAARDPHQRHRRARRRSRSRLRRRAVSGRPGDAEVAVHGDARARRHALVAAAIDQHEVAGAADARAPRRRTGRGRATRSRARRARRRDRRRPARPARRTARGSRPARRPSQSVLERARSPSMSLTATMRIQPPVRVRPASARRSSTPKRFARRTKYCWPSCTPALRPAVDHDEVARCRSQVRGTVSCAPMMRSGSPGRWVEASAAARTRRRARAAESIAGGGCAAPATVATSNDRRQPGERDDIACSAS